MLRFKVTEDKPLTTNTNGTASTYCKIGEREYARCSPWQSIHPPGGQCGYTDPTLGCVGGSHLPPTPRGGSNAEAGDLPLGHCHMYLKQNPGAHSELKLKRYSLPGEKPSTGCAGPSHLGRKCPRLRPVPRVSTLQGRPENG